jgi:hypothetical protein
MILSDYGESPGNLPADLCNVISPLLDLGFIVFDDVHVSYLERIKDRSRYAQQGVLFVEVTMNLLGI